MVVIDLWIISMQNKLVIFDEKVKSFMSHIEWQISSHVDDLCILLDVMKDYARSESERLIEQLMIKEGCLLQNLHKMM